MKKCFALIFMFPFLTVAQLELAQIMKGNEFIGHLPQNIRWDISGEKVCYDLLKGKELKTLCYNHKTKIIDTASVNLIYFDRSQSSFDRQYEIKNNEISCWDKKQKKKSLLFSSAMRISNLQRVNDQSQIYFQIGKDLFQWTLGESTKLQQVTNFVDKSVEKASKNEGYLFEQQQELFEYFSEDETSSQVSNGNHKLKSNVNQPKTLTLTKWGKQPGCFAPLVTLLSFLFTFSFQFAFVLNFKRPRRRLRLTIGILTETETNGVSEIAAPHRRRAPAFRTFVLQLRITAI